MQDHEFDKILKFWKRTASEQIEIPRTFSQSVMRSIRGSAARERGAETVDYYSRFARVSLSAAILLFVVSIGLDVSPTSLVNQGLEVAVDDSGWDFLL